MSAVKELLRTEPDGTLSFGDYEQQTKQKLSDYEYQGGLYKVKTFKEITKLECNETFVYESVPGTAVTEMKISDIGMSFDVEGPEDAQITLGVEEDTDYQVLLDDVNVGHMMTGMGGKLSFSVELTKGRPVHVRVIRLEK
jgi:hypothetical protein